MRALPHFPSGLAMLACLMLTSLGGLPAAAEEVAVFATGKVVVEQGVVHLRITSARHRDGGGGINDLTGKTLQVGSGSAVSLERLADKDVSVRGSVRDGKEIDVVWVGVREERTASPTSQDRRQEETSAGSVRAVGKPLGAVEEQGRRTPAYDDRERTGRRASPSGAASTRETRGAIGSVGAVGTPRSSSARQDRGGVAGVSPRPRAGR